MNRVSLVLVASLVACGGGGGKKQTNLAPLPDEKPAEAKVEPKVEEPKPEPPKPLPPLEVKFDVPVATVKLVSAGKGAKSALKYTAKPGAKQSVEVVMNFAQTAAADGQSDEQVVPAIVLTGEAETKTVEPNGKANYTLTVSGVDAREAPGNQVPLDKFKVALASLAGLVVSGNIDPNGTMTDTLLRIEKPDQLSTGALDLMRTTLPIWPVFPKEPVGIGAKWQASRSVTLKPSAQAQAGIEMTHTTDYELVSKKGSMYTIKSKTSITGKDQELQGAKISKITGTGAADITLEEGALYPSYTSKLESNLMVTLGDKSEQHGFKIGGAINAKKADGAAPAPAPALKK